MRGKMWVSKSRLVLVVHLIGWEDGVSFLDQSQSEVTHNQNIPEFTFDTHFKIVLFVRHQSEEPQSFLR